MADELHAYDFRTGRPNEYPWDTWLNGSPWRVYPGRDFTSTVESFRRSAGRAAARRGQVVRTRRDGDALIICASPLPVAMAVAA